MNNNGLLFSAEEGLDFQSPYAAKKMPIHGTLVKECSYQRRTSEFSRINRSEDESVAAKRSPIVEEVSLMRSWTLLWRPLLPSLQAMYLLL